MRYIILSSVLLFFSFLSFASPAPDKFVVITQPDGSTISIRIQGDEYLSWASTTDGYTIIPDEEGYYVYAVKDREGNLIPSTIRVHNPGERKKPEISFTSEIEKGLFFSPQQLKNVPNTSGSNARVTEGDFPAKGNNRMICILVSFKDKPFNLSKSDFTKLFNENGYSVNQATGSVRDYFLEASYNQLDLKTDVYGPYTLSQNESYYGKTGGETKEMAKEAVVLADKDIDFASYDINGDKRIKGVYIMTPGKDETHGGGPDAIWPHQGSFSKDTPKLDGMSFSYYACSGELYDDGTIVSIGTICHETGHLLGARDYYDTDGREDGDYAGAGYWDLMSVGNHNNEGRTPAHPNAFIKTKVFGWAIPNLLFFPQKNVELKNIEDNSNQYYYFTTPTINEYFLMENRVKKGFDRHIPGEGLIIYHVHKDLTTTYKGANKAHPQMMYPVCAGAGMDPSETGVPSYGEINSNLCPFPGDKNIKAFAINTLPSNKSWAGEEAYGHLTNIRFNQSDKVVSFDFSCEDPYNLQIRPVSSSQIRLAWNAVHDMDVVITRSTSETFLMSLSRGNEYHVGDYVTFENKVVYTGNHTYFLDEGLEPSTRYYYHLWGKVNGVLEYMDPLRANETTGTLQTKEFEKSLTEYFDEGGTKQYWQTTGYKDFDSEWKFECDGTDPNYGCTSQTSSNRSELISPVVICEGYDSVKLRFNHYLQNSAFYTATVYYTVDNGENWKIINHWSGEVVDREFTYYIPTNGAEKIRFKWVMNNQSASLWRLYYVLIDSYNDRVTGIEDIADTDISVYPNPSEDLLNIKMTGLSGDADVKLYNLYGEVVYQKHIFNVRGLPTHTIYTDALNKGFYLLRVNTKGYCFSQKVLVNN